MFEWNRQAQKNMLGLQNICKLAGNYTMHKTPQSSSKHSSSTLELMTLCIENYCGKTQ